MTLTINENDTLTLNDIEAGDTLRLGNDAYTAANEGALATVVSVGNRYVNIKWHRDGLLDNGQMDGNYNAEMFDLLPPSITIEDESSVADLPVGIVLQLDSAIYKIRKVAANHWVWAAGWLTGTGDVRDEYIKDGSGWLPAIVVNPEIFGEFTPLPALIYAKGDRVMVDYNCTSEAAKRAWDGPATVEKDFREGDYTVSIIPDSGDYAGAFIPSDISPYVDPPKVIYSKGDPVTVDYVQASIWNGQCAVAEDFTEADTYVVVYNESLGRTGGFRPYSVTPYVDPMVLTTVDQAKALPIGSVVADKLSITPWVVTQDGNTVSFVRNNAYDGTDTYDETDEVFDRLSEGEHLPVLFRNESSSSD